MPISLVDLEIVPFDPARHDVSTFDCDDDDLNDFLRHDAAKYQADHLSHTRVVFLAGTLVGYITLLADCIILQTSEKKKALTETRPHHQSVYTFPAIKIGRVGIQKEYQTSGIGTQLLIYTIGLVVRLNRELNIGCRFITLDAYPKSVSWYQQKNFMFNKHYGRPPNGLIAGVSAFISTLWRGPKPVHPSMRYDILKSPRIV
jgi:GNAT superfamily N-acetyltransferase